ncbi:MAG: cytidine deaminase [Planctomycetota bacterium]
MHNELEQTLLSKALEARQKAYAPYSNFKVGAALITKEGKLFTGCNVENSSYGLSFCAERTAICKAVSEGFQQFQTIVVVAHPFATPCGACRQFICEFGSDTELICADAEDVTRIKRWKISELIPDSFKFLDH